MPEVYPTNLLHVWDEVGLRIMVLFGLFSYFLLTLLGRWRNVIPSCNVAVSVFWFAYNALDRAPTVTYGTYFDKRLRSTNVTADPNLVLTVFWFPFVLLHNGFPDTVTSYSLADNETWKRYLAILFMKMSIFIDYVLKFWDGSCLCYLSLVIFVIGGLNCLERACAQRSASKACFRNYVYQKRPKANPNLGPSALPVDQSMDTFVNISVDQPQHALLFRMGEQKFAGLSLNPQDIEFSKSYFQQTPFDAAFQETGWVIQSMYDFFCTKAFVFRCPLLKLGHLIMCAVLLAVSIIAFFDIQRADYATKYVVVTYLLVTLTCISKVYEVFNMLGSSYMPYLLREKKTWFAAFPYKANSSFQHPVAEKTKAFISMPQFNLIEHCLHKKPTKCTGILNINRPLIVLKTFCSRHSVVAPKQLLQEIHGQLVERSTSARTTWLLKINFPWNPEIELWKTIACLHMVTTLCYFQEEQPDSTISRRVMSKWLSDYMIHVLRCWSVFMGNSFEGFEQASDDVIMCFSDGDWPSSVSQACKAIVSRGSMVGVEEEKRLSILYNAVQCYSLLYQSEAGVMWEAIFNGWTALLCFSAYKSSWIDHREQLLLGDQLLTHIWLQIAYLNLTVKIQFQDQVDPCSNQVDQRQGTIFMHQAHKGCKLGEIQIESTMNDQADRSEGSSTRKFDEIGKQRRNFGLKTNASRLDWFNSSKSDCSKGRRDMGTFDCSEDEGENETNLEIVSLESMGHNQVQSIANGQSTSIKTRGSEGQVEKDYNAGKIQRASAVAGHFVASSMKTETVFISSVESFEGEEASTRKFEPIGIGDDDLHMLSDEGIMRKLEMVGSTSIGKYDDDERNMETLETLGMASEEDEDDSGENFQAGHTEKEQLDHLLQQEFLGEKIKENISEQETRNADN